MGGTDHRRPERDPAAQEEDVPIVEADAPVGDGLPEELRPHLLDCLLKPAEIVLFAESASWATRLRVAAIEAADAGAFAGLTVANPRVTVRVSPRPQRR